MRKAIMSYKQKIYIENISDHIDKSVELNGWVYNKRGKGKLNFILLRDGTGTIQCVAFKPNLGEEKFDVVKSLNQESSIKIKGKVVASEKAPGGYEIDVEDIEVYQLSGDYPITPKEHGDSFLIENRHLWLRSSRQHAIMRIRASVMKAIRDFFDGLGFKLIDSPIFTPNACEGTSTLFETEYFDIGSAYLSQSGQLYAEASAMALGKVYTFGPAFRAEKSKTRKHLTEFWMVEPEMAFYDLQDDMELAEDMTVHIVKTVLRDCRKELEILERDISKLEKVTGKFPRISYSDAVDKLNEMDIPLIRKVDGQDVEIRPFPWGEDFGTPQEEALTADLDQPLFIYNYPTEIKAFYMKRDPNNPKEVLAMDMIGPESSGELIGGSQREDNIDYLEERIKEEDLDMTDFKWYMDLRKYGSVPHSGFGMGVERTVKWITGAKHIRECIPFPRMIHRIVP
ncbi:asparagine--tRNA ligase [Candidatus Kapabacteria bacterium]|nr:asparagine--tRNA ligase [Candidatus Kapabacteria bacterium]